MKILMSADTIGGVWRYALDLIRGLGREGIEVHLATLGAPLSATQHHELSSISNVTVHEGSYRLEWMSNPWQDIATAGEWLQTLADEHEVDFVHLNHLSHGDLPFDVPVLTVVHSCVLSWWRAVHGEDAPPEWDRYRARVGASLLASDHVVTPTRSLQQEVVACYGLSDAPEVIGNASFDAERWHRHSDPRLREPFIVSAGRVWDSAKNIETLDRAACALSWPSIVAGSNTSPDGRECTLASLRYTGVLSHEELNRLLSRAAIYALPARYEPFGLSVLEAAHAGCALVLGDIESLRETWSGAALFVEPNDHRELARTLNRVMGDAPLREWLSRCAQRRARSMCFDTMVARYLECYRGLGAGLHSGAGVE